MAPYFTGIAIIFGAVLATVGWFVTTRFQQIHSRRQHTFDVYHSYRDDKHFHDVKRRVQKFFDTDDFPQAGDNQRTDDIESLDWLLNHYEFIAGAIMTGDIDERLIKVWECTRMIKLFRHSKDYIDSDRVLGKQPTMYENLQKVCERWENSDRTKCEKLYEFFMLRPCQRKP